jgi:adenylate cyclase
VGRAGTWWARVNAPLVAAAVATAVCAGAYGLHRTGAIAIPSLEAWELATLDARFRLRGERAAKDDRIVIVGIDDETREKNPELIQSRRGWARLVDRLAGYEPELVAVDAFFQSPEVNLSRETVAAAVAARDQLAAETAPTPAAAAARAALEAVIAETSGDAAFAAAVARAGNVLIAVMFGLEGEPEPDGAREPPALAGARYGEQAVIAASPARSPPRASWTASSLPVIAAAQGGAGFVNVIPDADGQVRRMPLVIERAGRFYMPLGLAVAARHLEADTGYLTGALSVRFGDRELPVDPRGQALLSFLGEGDGESIAHVSASAVLDGSAPREALAGKLVFIGYTDSARDTVASPFNPTFHGVELHATLAHNILHGELLRQAGPWTTILTILLLGGLLTLVQLKAIRRRRAWIPAATAATLLAATALAAQIAFAGGLVLEVVAPAAAVIAVALASLSTGLATEGREKAQLRAAFSQYVQGTLVDRILADPARVKLGGVRRELTVLFSDIRGFSRFSEGLEPEQLSAFLNEYLTPMTELVMDAGGMLDKYIGDAIMAVYGAPLEMPDHAARACTSALRMQAALEPLNRGWVARGLPELHIGVGINSGPMSVGNMGSEARFDYTVLGDAVNLGARLEALTKELGARILVGERTAELAGDRFVFRELARVRVQGREAAARVFELLAEAGASPFSDEDLALYQRAVEAVQAQDWETAAEAAAAFAERHPEDRPVAILFQRIAELSEEPPDPGWTGAWTQQSK